MGHDHGSHASFGAPQRLLIVLLITSSILLAEIVGAVVSSSLSLLADAGHMLADVAGLVLALIAARLAARPRSDRRTWGMLRAEVVAASLQAGLLTAASVVIVVLAVRRLFAGADVHWQAMLWFSLLALLGNAVALWVLVAVRSENLNLRAAFLEVLNDALGAMAVLIAAIVVALSGWDRADAVASIAIAVMIVPRALKVLRESISILLESAPPGLDLIAVREHLRDVPGVIGIHDLHVSRVSSTLPVLTAHVCVDSARFQDGSLPGLLDAMQQCLAEHFDIRHSTVQFEPPGHEEHEDTEHH